MRKYISIRKFRKNPEKFTEQDKVWLCTKQKLSEKFGDLRFEIRVVNPTNGCHAGPDCVSIAFHAKHR